jgi:hypothetical protein
MLKIKYKDRKNLGVWESQDRKYNFVGFYKCLVIISPTWRVYTINVVATAINHCLTLIIDHSGWIVKCENDVRGQ